MLHLLLLTVCLAFASATQQQPAGSISLEKHKKNFPPLGPKDHYSWKCMYTTNHYLPVKMWVRIMHKLDHVTIWNLGLTCKWLGAVVRDHNLKITNIWQNPKRLAQLLIFSQLNIHKRHMEYICPWLLTRFPKHVASAEKPCEAVYAHALDLFNIIYERAGSPKMISWMFAVWPHFKQEDMLKLVLWMDVWAVPHAGGHKIIYLSPESHLYHPRPHKLFDIVDWRRVLSFQFAGSQGSSLDKSHMFSLVIASEYLAPYCQKPFEIPKTHLKAIRAMAPYIQKETEPSYFVYLMWAMNFATKHMRSEQNNSALKDIRATFEHFRLEWKDFGKDCASVPPTTNMEAIYLIAKQWGINIQAIARNTSSWCNYSAEIIKGVTPKFLAVEEIGSREIARVLFKGEPLERLTRDFDGNFTTEEEFDRQFKRQRDEQNMEWQNPKRQKIAHEEGSNDQVMIDTVQSIFFSDSLEAPNMVQPFIEPTVLTEEQRIQMAQQAAYFRALQFQAEYIRQLQNSHI